MRRIAAAAATSAPWLCFNGSVRTAVDASGRFPRALAVACALALAASAAAASARTPRAPAPDPANRVALRDLACHPALDPPDRSVSVTAVMRPLSTPEHLSLRATLLRRRGHGKFRSLKGGALGPWITPKDP